MKTIDLTTGTNLFRCTLILMLVFTVLNCYVYLSRQIDTSGGCNMESTTMHQVRQLFAPNGTTIDESLRSSGAVPSTTDHISAINPNHQMFVRQWHLDLEGHNNNLNRNSTNYVYPLQWLNEQNQIIYSSSNTSVNYNFIVLAVRYDVSRGEFVLLTTVHSYEQHQPEPTRISYHHNDQNFARTIRKLLSLSLSISYIYTHQIDTTTEVIKSIPVICKFRMSQGINEFFCKWTGFPSLPPEDLTIQLNYHGLKTDFDNISQNQVRDSFLNQRFSKFSASAYGKLSFPVIWSLNLPVKSSMDPMTTFTYCSANLYSAHYINVMKSFVEYHLFMGIEKFTIYDRYGLYYSKLKPYIDAGIVDYQHTGEPIFKEPIRTVGAYWDQMYMLEVCRYRNYASSSWIGFWDFDEYIMAPVDTKHSLNGSTASTTTTTTTTTTNTTTTNTTTPSANTTLNSLSKVQTNQSDEDPSSTNVFPSTCIKYNPTTEIFEFDYQNMNINSIQQSLKSHPFHFQSSPLLYGLNFDDNDFNDPNSSFHSTSQATNITSANKYLDSIAGHCRSLLSDFFVQQSIRSHQIDYFIENIPVSVVQFVDPNPNLKNIMKEENTDDETSIAPPDRFMCFDCEQNYRFNFRRLDPYKSLYPPQSDSHYNIHTSTYDSQQFRYNTGGYRFRPPPNTRGPLGCDQLFFAHFRNAIQIRDRVDARKSANQSISFWQEGSTVTKLIRSMKRLGVLRLSSS